MNNPILVTGVHRSGTTWVGKMLCASGEAFYIFEPFNIGTIGPNWMKKAFPHWFFYLCPENINEYETSLQNIIAMRYPIVSGIRKIRTLRHCGRIGKDVKNSIYARLRKKRPLIKDPIALFSTEWLANRFDMQIIVMIRHPAAFASSLKRLNWQFDFANWYKQELLMQNFLYPFRDQIREYTLKKKDIIDQAILMWNSMYSVVHLYQQSHPDWMFVKHETLAANPLEEFQNLYQYFGLTWNKRAKSVILAYTVPANVKEVSLDDPGTIKRDSKATIKTWKLRLTRQEIQRVRAGTREVATLFYDETEWK